MFVCLKVKLVGRVMPKFEFNLKSVECLLLPLNMTYIVTVFRRFVCKSSTLLNRNFYICQGGINFT